MNSASSLSPVSVQPYSRMREAANIIPPPTIICPMPSAERAWQLKRQSRMYQSPETPAMTFCVRLVAWLYPLASTAPPSKASFMRAR